MFFRRRYGGELIHVQRDGAGVIEVVDKDGVRSLHFGNANRQSACSISQPDRVELSYIRAMLLSLLFTPHPERILILGLGGGSLAKFLWLHYPASTVTVLECRSAMLPVARRFFGLPDDDRLEVITADGAEHICEAAARSTPPFDHIYIDAFDQDGLSPNINRPEFFQACAQLLHPSGCLAMNLWGTHKLCLAYSLRLLAAHFPHQSSHLEVPHKSNVIGFGLGPAVIRETGTECQRAFELEQRLHLELPVFHAALKGNAAS